MSVDTLCTMADVARIEVVLVDEDVDADAVVVFSNNGDDGATAVAATTSVTVGIGKKGAP
jgi:hypothetical protein